MLVHVNNAILCYFSKDITLTLKDLYNSSNLDILSERLDLFIQLCADGPKKEFIIPKIMGEIDDTPNYNFNIAYQVAQNNRLDPSLIPKCRDAINKKVPNFNGENEPITIEQTKQILDSIGILYTQITETFIISDENFRRTYINKEADSLFKKFYKPMVISYPHQNITTDNKNKDYDGYINMQLPDTSEMDNLLFTLSNDEWIIKEKYGKLLATIMAPYSSVLYNTKIMDMLFNIPSEDTRYKKVMASSEDLKADNIDITKLDRIKQLVSDRNMPSKMEVYGDDVNNASVIYDNEKELYENLIYFIKFHISRSNKKLNINDPSKDEDDFSHGVLPENVKQYFTLLFYFIFQISRGYYGGYPVLVSTNINDEEEEALIAGDSETLKLAYKNDNLTRALPHFELLDYIQESAEIYGCSVWASCFIQALRFSFRKVSAIIAEPDTLTPKSYFCLKTMSTKIEAINLLDYEVIEYTDGVSFTLTSVNEISVPTDTAPVETIYYCTITRTYKHKNSDEYATKDYIISLQDIIDEYINGNPLIYGIEFEDGKFSAYDDSINSVPKVQSLYDLTEPYKELYFYNTVLERLGIKSSPTIVSTIISKEDESSIMSGENISFSDIVLAPKVERSILLTSKIKEVFKDTLVELVYLDDEEDRVLQIFNSYYDFVYNDFKEKLYENNFEEGTDVEFSDFQSSTVFSQIDDSEDEEYLNLEELGDIDMKYLTYDIENNKSLLKTVQLIQVNNKNKKDDPDKLVGYYALTPAGDAILVSVGDDISIFKGIAPSAPVALRALNILIIGASVNGKDGVDNKKFFLTDKTLFNIYNNML